MVIDMIRIVVMMITTMAVITMMIVLAAMIMIMTPMIVLIVAIIQGGRVQPSRSDTCSWATRAGGDEE